MTSTLTPKERVRRAFNHVEPDRVPINYLANPGIDARLKAHFGLKPDDHEGLLQALQVDFRALDPAYRGPTLFDEVPGRSIDIWGIHRRLIEHESGSYWDYCDFPLRDADLEMIENWPMPDPDDFDYETMLEQAKIYQSYWLSVGNAGLGDIINATSMLRNMEVVLIDLISDDEACLRLIDRRLEIQLEITRRSLEILAERVDMLWIGEDLGTQIGPMISKKLYRKHIRPRHQQFIDLAKTFGLPVMIHSCGSSSWAFNDFIEMGINIVDTLQPEAVDMSPAYLVEQFGGKLAFHGCISTAGPVAYGSVEDTRENVRKTLEIMKPDGGYALAPTHALQDNSPTENVLAMYEAAITYGQYS
ncbi:MAG: hypothetical protein JW750_08580 [Anaerolineaceae bacterium]|nr:hypothetical protein [Anaerolineaceae bacterium]